MSTTMQETKNNNSSNEDAFKKKERHIVTWTQQEDDILRQEISKHGTENWAIIASKFKDKTTRQCRRRWYTYLNSDFKKGGWSPEEDLLLCEAQRVFGNRWTEIAKVVSGRTDNAVKNRFSTLCKKRAKCEALAKEKKSTYINSNNKRVIFHSGFSVDGTPETALPAKKIRRPNISDPVENCCFGNRSHLRSGGQQNRPPFEVLAQKFYNADMADQHAVSNAVKVPVDAQSRNSQGTFLKRDDPKITALMQQAEFLSSLALKVNSENTDQHLENAWKVVQDFLNQSKENDILEYRISDIDIQLEEVIDMIEGLRSCNNGSQPSWGKPEPYEESSASSEYSTESTLTLCRVSEKIEHSHDKIVALQEDIETELLSVPNEEQNTLVESDKEIIPGTNTNLEELFPPSVEKTNREISVSASSTREFSSPLQVTPLFRSLAAGIPSPKFSESERNFLLKTLGVESPCSNPTINRSQPPLCKKALLQSLTNPPV